MRKFHISRCGYTVLHGGSVHMPFVMWTSTSIAILDVHLNCAVRTRSWSNMSLKLIHPSDTGFEFWMHKFSFQNATLTSEVNAITLIIFVFVSFLFFSQTNTPAFASSFAGSMNKPQPMNQKNEYSCVVFMQNPLHFTYEHVNQPLTAFVGPHVARHSPSFIFHSCALRNAGTKLWLDFRLFLPFLSSPNKTVYNAEATFWIMCFTCSNSNGISRGFQAIMDEILDWIWDMDRVFIASHLTSVCTTKAIDNKQCVRHEWMNEWIKLHTMNNFSHSSRYKWTVVLGTATVANFLLYTFNRNVTRFFIQNTQPHKTR